jgi:hypothetical protein
MSQVKAWAPLAAAAPIVSSPTRVQIRKNRMSKRPKCFWSFFFSSRANAVVVSSRSSGSAVLARRASLPVGPWVALDPARDPGPM